VASAEGHYVDPSALRSAYIHDDRSRGFCAWRAKTSGPLTLTRHGRAELVNSVMLGVFRNVLDDATARLALADVDADIADGSLAVVDILWRRALDLAAELSSAHTAKLGVRTLDVLHVAAARTLEKRVFVTYDERQAALARAVKLRVLAP
jgi:predicted nucleic acid-binding protein